MMMQQLFRFTGFLYAILLLLIIAYLLYSGRWRQKAGWISLLITSCLGFLIFSPMVPNQFQQLVLRDVQGLGTALIIGAIGASLLIVLTIIFGRIFCGYLCPIGALQELVYLAPVRKIGLQQKRLLIAVRMVVFLLFLVMAFVFSASLIDLFGFRQFFSFTVSAGSILFLIILLLGLVFYRPFCRLICPYGALLTVAGFFSIFKLRRTDSCIRCKKCESVCPAQEAGPDDGKADCYLCGRCIAVCPVPGALLYRWKGWNQKKGE